MGNWTNLKSAVDAAIKENNNQEITGSILNNIIKAVIGALGANAAFAGIASPSSNPGTPDGTVFYIATEIGSYPNFGGITVSSSEIFHIFLQKNDDSEWVDIPISISDSIVQSIKNDFFPIKTNDIADNAITTDKIANLSITNAKLAYTSVTSNRIANGAVGNEKIADKAITNDKITDKAITNDKIANGAVGNEKIADKAITTDKIADNAIITDKIADNAITTDKIADKAITTDKIANLSITNAKLAYASVTSNRIANGAVGDEKIADKAITNDKIADKAITNDKIADNAIITDKIRPLSIVFKHFQQSIGPDIAKNYFSPAPLDVIYDFTVYDNHGKIMPNMLMQYRDNQQIRDKNIKEYYDIFYDGYIYPVTFGKTSSKVTMKSVGFSTTTQDMLYYHPNIADLSNIMDFKTKSSEQNIVFDADLYGMLNSIIDIDDRFNPIRYGSIEVFDADDAADSVGKYVIDNISINDSDDISFDVVNADSAFNNFPAPYEYARINFVLTNGYREYNIHISSSVSQEPFITEVRFSDTEAQHLYAINNFYNRLDSLEKYFIDIYVVIDARHPVPNDFDIEIKGNNALMRVLSDETFSVNPADNIAVTVTSISTNTATVHIHYTGEPTGSFSFNNSCLLFNCMYYSQTEVNDLMGLQLHNNSIKY